MTQRASRIIGAAVVDRHGRRLGRVSDLLLAASGPASPSYALVDLKPPALERERTVAVPWSVLEHDEQHGALRLDVSRETLARLRPWAAEPPISPEQGVLAEEFSTRGGKFFR